MHDAGRSSARTRSKPRRSRRSASASPPAIKAAFDQGVVASRRGRLREGRSELQDARSSRTATAPRRWPIWPRRSPRPATTARRRARGRPRSSTAPTSRRSISGSATRCCARTTSARRARFSRRRSASGRPTSASPSRWRCCTGRSARDAKRCARSSATSRSEPDDRDAYLYAVQWIYTVHAGGAVVHNRAEDLKLARDLRGRRTRRPEVRSCRSSSSGWTIWQNEKRIEQIAAIAQSLVAN